MVGELTHKCPSGRSGLMPCCGKTPFEVSRWDRLTVHDDLVTCPPGLLTIADCAVCLAQYEGDLVLRALARRVAAASDVVAAEAFAAGAMLRFHEAHTQAGSGGG